MRRVKEHTVEILAALRSGKPIATAERPLAKISWLLGDRTFALR
jgi:hypothetical protein